MSLLNLIKRARRQPRHVRDNIAFFTAAGITAVIAVIWVYHSPGNFNLMTDEAGANNGKPFFAQIRSSIAEQTATVKEAFSTTEPVESNGIEPVATSSSPNSTFTLTEENRRAVASSSANAQAEATTTADTRRVVRIATTTSSSSESGQ